MSKQTKLEVAKKIAEGAAHMASVHAKDASKSAARAEIIAKDAVDLVDEIKGMPADLQKGFEQQVDALRKQFEEAVKGLVEKLEAAVKSAEAKVVAVGETTDACVKAAEACVITAELASASASRAEGAVGHLNELGIKPIEPEPEPATPAEVAAAIDPPSHSPVP
jgi:hypothetical protein